MSAVLFKSMSESSCRIERILHLGTMLTDSYAYSPDLEDSIEDWDFVTQCFGDDVPSEIEDIDDLQDWIMDNDMLGFCVQFATPVVDGKHYSWGHYSTQWFYGNTFEEVLAKGIEWAKATGPVANKR